MGVLPQPAQTALSVSAQIPLTLQTQSLLLPLSTSGAQAPGRNKEHCMMYPEVSNACLSLRTNIFQYDTFYTYKLHTQD